MPCEKYHTGGGGTVIICTGRGAKRKPNCACGYTGTRLCDWKIGGGKTCDTPICPRCTFEPAEDKDLCPKHAAEWKRRLAAR
jgi:hypothetical protein